MDIVINKRKMFYLFIYTKLIQNRRHKKKKAVLAVSFLILPVNYHAPKRYVVSKELTLLFKKFDI